eukprot:COSAG01_NODE_1255_length_11040_cov_67.549584_6_plen_78_part_00
MHQFGHGLPKDFHLAKRFYDQTLQASGDDVAAQAPVILAIYGLRLAVWWYSAHATAAVLAVPRSLKLYFTCAKIARH